MAEADWKRLRAVHKTALERFCTRTLEECAALIASDASSAHEKYLGLWRLLRERDKELASAFDDMRRSQANWRLAAMVKLKVVTDEELQQFSPEMRQSAEYLAGMSEGE